MRPVALRTEHLTDPIGLDTPNPRFSWQLDSDDHDVRQRTFRIRVATEQSEVADLWDSGPIASDRTQLLPYDGEPLRDGLIATWDVTVTDATGRTATSDRATFEIGRLRDRAWSTPWIAGPAALHQSDEEAPPDCSRPLRYHTSFATSDVARARLHVTARGLYDARVNGTPVASTHLLPGWVDYRDRLPSQVHDVTQLVRNGDNDLGIEVASGWWSGHVAWTRAVYGDRPSVSARLVLTHVDGSTTTVATDDRWRVAPSPRPWADLLHGEALDLRLGDDEWRRLDDTVAVEIVTPPEAPVVAHPGPLVTTVRELEPVAVSRRPDGTIVYDFGQNLVGVVRLELSGRAGQRIEVRHAEMLDDDGSLHTDNYRSARCTDVVTLADDRPVTVTPRFTFRGFRYAGVTGIPVDEVPPRATAEVWSSMTRDTGGLTTSNAMINRLVENVQWGQRGNFVEVPTDCPQRDERLGWSGDIQIFAPTAAWLGDTARFLDSWLRDLRAGQRDGAFPDVAPLVDPEFLGRGAPAWGDAGVIVPWVLHQRYGDERILREAFPAMCAWVARIARDNPDHLWRHGRGNDYGDWLNQHDDTPREVLATAYWAHDADLVARIADVLGDETAADHHRRMAQAVRRAFVEAYVTPSGRIVGHTQTAYVLALVFHLLPAALRAAAVSHLVDRIEQPRGFQSPFVPGHLATGFVGVGHLLPALSDNGHLDLAYRLLETDDFPSWGYSIRHGATTIWERWDGWTDVDGFKPATMNSFNHYALGSVVDWLFRVVGGIQPLDEHPGMSHVRIQPRPGGTITSASAWHDGPHGRIETAWEVDGSGRMALGFDLPPNTSAEVVLPVMPTSADGTPLDGADGIRTLDTTRGAVVTVGSGRYDWVVPTLVTR